jgi:cbb3-type cytochrome oxidase maturation protein
MTDFLYLVPIALALGAVGLGTFMWTLRSGQYDDLDGAAERVLLDDDDRPAVSPSCADRPAPHAGTTPR